MKTKLLSLLLGFTLVFILNACSPSSAVIPTEEVPQPGLNGQGYQELQIDDVQVEVGVGSPIPVHVHVSGSLPHTCAQVSEVRLHRDGTSFFVRLVAYLPAETDCAEDSIPFRLEIPLNVVGLPEGPYVVNVNGTTVIFDPRATPASP
jgi:hypothetical protein